MSDPDVPLRPPAILARHGARAHVTANTIDAFGLALDAWRLDAGAPVVATAPTVRRGLRRRPVTSLDPSELPPDVVAVADVVAAVPPATVLLVTPGDAGTARAVVEAV